MNGSEAMQQLESFKHMKLSEIELFETIERELKVNKILKEKKVDLPQIAEWLADDNLKNIKETTEYYNRYIVNGYMEELTEEEMTLIVELLKEE